MRLASVIKNSYMENQHCFQEARNHGRSKWRPFWLIRPSAQVQPVSMTENFSISDGKSVIKLDLGVAVEALGMSGPPRSTEIGEDRGDAGSGKSLEVTGPQSSPLFLGGFTTLTFSH